MGRALQHYCTGAQLWSFQFWAGHAMRSVTRSEGICAIQHDTHAHTHTHTHTQSTTAEQGGSALVRASSARAMVKLNKHARMRARMRARQRVRGESYAVVASDYGVSPLREGGAATGRHVLSRRWYS